ncbi:DUF3119 family protein [Leptolyngbya sp. FACHB-711]|uniref:DUF3119 family protein n=1 Tax=unclassified Leptolyngbya TaxID=2650499 RepID=UPI00168815F6|nr:DUF3119 family protein [Leptolyngbya sp. FACHB-711]MBD1850881.1 DUF3119 family protein [Cyanobacteria bacterium FACHB-502]MBD2023414.1 DUF3119 family protein [Leptolyngbya sp. FACHB-711]
MTTSPTASTPPAATETVQLEPSYAIPIVLVLAAIPLWFVNSWVSGTIALLGLFLLIQAATLRLRFTPVALEVYRGEKMIRCFPYQEWQNWRIFWVNVPILLYFKEVKSIHFLPVLFDAKLLRICLEQRCPRIDSVSDR